MMYNEMRLAHLAAVLANLLLGIALMGGGAFLARRSIASATWAVIAGFAVVSADVLRASAMPLVIRFGIPSFYLYAPISLAEATVSMGGLILAIRALPPRTSWIP